MTAILTDEEKKRYSITPAKYAKDKMAIRLHKPVLFVMRWLIERSLKCTSNWSHREEAYIVSRRKAEHFRLLVANDFQHYSGDEMSDEEHTIVLRGRANIFTVKGAIAAIKSGQFEVEEFLDAVDGV